MSNSKWNWIQQKVIPPKDLNEVLSVHSGEKIVFTNGCFDLIHYGHIYLLSEAADKGDMLIVGVNSDQSVQRLKGKGRPVIPFDQRAIVLAALSMVDYVIKFEEDTPLELIKALQPDVLVKGGDYTPENVVGADIVKKKGGEVSIVKYLEGFSTTSLAEKIRSGDGRDG